MEHLETLKKSTLLAQKENGLPDFLAERIFQIVETLTNTDLLVSEVTRLAEQVAEYDTFAQTGYMGMGVDNLILETSILNLETQIKVLKESL